MFSFYVLHSSSMTSNSGDMASDIHVLADRGDLAQALALLRGDHSDICQLRIYQRGRLSQVVDLLARRDGGGATVDADEYGLFEEDGFGGGFDDDGEEDGEPDQERLDLSPEGLDIPPLEAPVLPPGHPVRVDGRVLGYGCTLLYP